MTSQFFTRTERPLRWEDWDRLIEKNGIYIDRPYGTAHPAYAEIVYPIDYGYIQNTAGSDGDEIDIFVGSATNKLVAASVTADFRKGDREVKLIYNCTPVEIYLVHGFLNFDPSLMTGTLVMRRPMAELWNTD